MRKRTRLAEAEASSSRLKYGDPRPLNLGSRIFISHSGKNKNFVRHLDRRLVDQLYRDERAVFFDEKSLPTAEPITMENILAEARACELGILVLTKEFFTQTLNPMLELETLTTSNVQLLPLFFGFSVEEFKKMKRENVWEEKWMEWLKRDEERLGAWKRALNFVDLHSGLEYWKFADNEDRFIDAIVNKVAHIVRPAISFSKKGVCGMDRLCKIVNDMYDRCASTCVSDHGCIQAVSTPVSAGRKEDSGKTLDLVGVYGFPGLGKSTLCSCLCNYYFADFHGRVCWLDLGSVPDSSQASSQPYSSNSALMWRMQRLLSKLMGDSFDGARLATTYRFEMENLVRNWVKKGPIFLAIDNILPDSNSREEARFYLQCEFAKGSKIFITSRTGDLLKEETSNYTSAVIEPIPELTVDDARGIFVGVIDIPISNVGGELVKECVSKCVIDNKWYHPLMLQSLGKFIRNGFTRDVNLESRFRMFLQSAVDKSNAWETVFNMLDISYAILDEDAKKVLLDMALLYKNIVSQSGWGCNVYEWIQTVYSHLRKMKLDKILSTLEDLSFIMEGCFIQKRFRFHDLMVDFAEYKMMEGAGAAGFNKQFLVLDYHSTQRRSPAFDFLAQAATSNQWLSNSAPPQSVRTISISGFAAGAQTPEVLDLRNFEGVEMLHLVHNAGVQEVLLSRTTLSHLRSFIIRHDTPLPCNTPLRCTIDESWPTPNRVMMSGKLVWVELDGYIIFSTCRKQSWWWPEGLLQRFGLFRSSKSSLGILQPYFLCNLEHLALSHFAAKSIDVTTCTNLKRMRLWYMPSLRSIHGLETLTNLERLDIDECGLEVINATTYTNLKSLRLRNMPRLSYIHGLEALTSLEELSVVECRELQLLSSPAAATRVYIGYCRSLERASFSCTEEAFLDIMDCPALRSVGGNIAQCTTSWLVFKNVAIEDFFETVSSQLKATVTNLQLHNAFLDEVFVRDVEHAGLLISAWGTDVGSLKISCKEDGNCGCDEIEPHFGPGLSPSREFGYHCPQVRNLASLPLIMGSGLWGLSLRGCGNVEVWPDFATMTSLQELDLSYTSLKERPTGVQLLGQLTKLDIQGCRQLPAEEMIKAITCKPLGCNSASGRGFLASLLTDLRCHRRDRASVAAALDSQWPELVSLIYEQWRYLHYPCPILYSSRPPITELEDAWRGAELCYLIRLLYDLWFGVECEDGSTCKDCYPCADGVSTIKEKLKRLLCSEIFMSLPFYSWRIGRTRPHAHDGWEGYPLDEWEGYPWPEGYEIYMAFALIGSASIGCFNAALNDDLKDRMVNFVQSFTEAQPQHAVDKDFDDANAQLVLETPDELKEQAHARLAMRVGDAVCKMARAPSMAAALGQDFMHITVDGLDAGYNIVNLSQEAVDGFRRWMTFTCPSLWKKHRRFQEGRIPRVAASRSGEASRHTSMSLDDDLGARVLLRIMPKILPQSVLEFYGEIGGVNDPRGIRCWSQYGGDVWMEFLR